MHLRALIAPKVDIANPIVKVQLSKKFQTGVLRIVQHVSYSLLLISLSVTKQWFQILSDL